MTGIGTMMVGRRRLDVRSITLVCGHILITARTKRRTTIPAGTDYWTLLGTDGKRVLSSPEPISWQPVVKGHLSVQVPVSVAEVIPTPGRDFWPAYDESRA